MDKKKLRSLTQRRAQAHKQMANLGPLMRGSVVLLATTCGNPNCQCTRGKKHRKVYFSLSTGGKTKLLYLGKSRETQARLYSNNYKKLLDIINKMTTINIELFALQPTKRH